ncbi:ABC transporter permease [Haloarchaeobius amylolyticus]|uniref:ABC transporter permease n=1 Tax=Haloarchaeobius amylolyticus TaxID=1198296 RepID=UPI0022706821|nr:ABC transporter permease [Haloarchaeobius amylolyticus]
MSTSNYAIKRILLLVPVLLGVSLVTFLFIRLSPSDPVAAMLPPEAAAQQNIVNELRQEMHLDEPLYLQYGHWLWDVVHLDFGYSYSQSARVTSLIASSAWATAQLSFFAFVIGVLVAIPMGVVSAVKKDSWVDNLTRVLAFGGISLPGFWVAIMMILVFALFWQNWFGAPLIPSGGYATLDDGVVTYLRHILPPAVVLGTGFAALVMRMTRSSMVEVLQEEYVRTARAKGVRERSIVMIHTFRNALIPVVTVMGMQIGFLLNGAVVIEQVFQWPGIGRLLYQSVLSQDLITVQGIVLFIATVFVVANLLVDLLYAYLDPRISYE